MTRKLNYANVAATIALALTVAGGTAIAAGKLVTQPSQLGKGVVTNGKVRKDTLKANRLTDEAREALAGQGEAGPAGPPGEAGPQGPPGPTASAYSNEFFGPDLGPSFGNMQNLTDLNSSTSGEIDVGFEGRVLVNGAVTIQNTDDVASFAFCRLQLENEAGEFVDLGESQAQDVGPDNGDFISIALTGAAERQPGTYDVRVQCRSPGPSYRYRHGSLTAWATAP